MLFQKDKFEGLYPVYKPFFDSVKSLGGEIANAVIVFPDTVKEEDVVKIVKPYKDYIQLTKEGSTSVI